MTRATFSRVLSVIVGSVVCSVFTSHVFANSMTAPTVASAPPSALTTDSAEFCTSVDGRVEIVRDFTGGESYIVIEAADPTSKPVIKTGFTYLKQAGGFTQKNEVSFEMFELMVEPFDNEPKDQKQWKKTFEEIFEGKITIVDGKGKAVATVAASCHAAVVDFN